MANYNDLKTSIQNVIKQNGANQITGNILQQTLISMINSLGANFTFAGFANPTTNPGTPDQNVFYFASVRGVYPNFNNAVVEDEMVVFAYTGTWAAAKTGIPSIEKVDNVASVVPVIFIPDKGHLVSIPFVGKDQGIFGTVTSSTQAYQTTDFVELSVSKDYLIVCDNSLASPYSQFRLYDANKNEIFDQRGFIADSVENNKRAFLIKTNKNVRYIKWVNNPTNQLIWLYETKGYYEITLYNEIKSIVDDYNTNVNFGVSKSYGAPSFNLDKIVGNTTVGIFETTGQTAYKTTDFIELEDGKYYAFSVKSHFNSSLTLFRLYDENKSEIFRQVGGGNCSFTIVKTGKVKYIRYATGNYENTENVFGEIIPEASLSKSVSVTKTAVVPPKNTLNEIPFVGKDQGIFGYVTSSTQAYQTTDFVELTDKNYLIVCGNPLASPYSQFRLYDANKNEIFDQRGGQTTGEGTIAYNIVVTPNVRYIKWVNNSGMLIKLYSIVNYEQLNRFEGLEKAVSVTKFPLVPPSNTLQEIPFVGKDVGIFERTNQTAYKTTDFVELTDKNYLIVCGNSMAIDYSQFRLYDEDKNEVFRQNGANPNQAPDGLMTYQITVTPNVRYIKWANNSEILIKLYKIISYAEPVAPEKTNHTVLWLGTSIPEGKADVPGFGNISYPELLCKKLGWTCYNNSVGASGICKMGDGVLGNGRDGKDLSESSAEKVARYSGHVGDGTGGTITQWTWDHMQNWGYDKLIIPYIDGTIASCDMVVFDHGFNDRLKIVEELGSYDSLEKSLIKDASDDRESFVGAFRFLIQKIWAVNPKIKIVICSYLERQSKVDDYQKCGSEVCEMLKKLSETYGYPYVPMCDEIGFTMRLAPGTEQYLPDFNQKWSTNYQPVSFMNEDNPNRCCSIFQMNCPDTVHPYTDRTGRSTLIIADALVKLMYLL